MYGTWVQIYHVEELHNRDSESAKASRTAEATDSICASGGSEASGLRQMDSGPADSSRSRLFTSSMPCFAREAA